MVGAEHPARFIREFVASLDLGAEGFSYEPGKVGKGALPYSPRLLLCAWLYGYMEKIRSTRGIEKACLNHLGMMWLVGMHKRITIRFGVSGIRTEKRLKSYLKKRCNLL